MHREAEVAAMLDAPRFITRAQELYGYANFVCDTSGSICEVVDPGNPADMVLNTLSKHLLMIWIEGTEAHTADLVRRFDRAPKPMYYHPDFLNDAWRAYLAETGLAPDAVDPDAFIRWTYARALAHRQPLYRAMAENWGLTVAAADIARVESAQDFNDLVARTLDKRAAAQP
jgi:hypothetical protein